MSDVVRRDACPKCRSQGRDTAGDNLAVFDDGHVHCFSCGHHTFPKYHPPVEKKNITISLPFDASLNIDKEGLTWLGQYGVTLEELIKYKIKWSDRSSMLLFPFYGEANTLVAWQGRNFNPNNKAKWYTVGPIDSVFPFVLTNADKCGIVLVEDIVSGIKVQRHIPCVPLFKSYVGPEKLARLKLFTNHLTFWWDYDKRKEAVDHAIKAQTMGFKTNVIVTDGDPKVYSDDAIKDFIGG